ncbi:MAG: ATP-dependent metallopeptidase FtsH/Yme1/Tma family protein [Candidatus Jettenia sp.]|uniref:ATP-dependent zinc metalloprotease FtsH n=1 Tax=Candidatus Jettenia caeni TaxID=247490 RepID=I3IQX8_9BACT|nr:ATP-dependent zinc metalloprotease FtsH [Candidatus Jettenia sp. AMX1]MBC6929582.1 ATP-dependent metallopeptidase FtsH/Yme1/Tma family protein [Candidatus Jettenia sp.]WKZ15537.1 MAG: ATP-dependent zinc metalloprotease FtsH [Candidatus Jettenia caeni]KAA0247975.1 MAG: ATP-dependent metallopeptidase FtsH/Yme1/Tma family protein [Candidatus Jettenia sp. AMX1]MCE7879702.1 ATP-dependent metallopeptidase FtsH/Yme1/Tma family protein [Candidatus Jettenia sp. AMX1]MCQ3927743.1 ATP-dependent metall
MLKKNKNKTKKTPFSIGYILLFLAVMYIVQMFLSPKAEELSYSQFRLYLKNGYISDCSVGANLIRGHYKKSSPEETGKEQKIAFVTVPIHDKELISELESQKVRFKGTTENNFLKNIFMWWVFPFGIMALGWFFLFKKVGGMGSPFMSFGKAKIKLYSDNGSQKTTFIDVAGCDEAKEELKEIIDFLSFPERFQKLGGKIPKGVLLIGPPGTGKTLLARAVAGEAGVPFFSISGSDFVEMFVGMGAARVRDMFEQAKEKAPCIVFIDEIDSVGRQRGTGLGGGHDEREQTLNQLLAEMDGFNSQKGVIIIAATNRPDVLDSALLRPGRFDRQVTVDRPDLIGREAILSVHAKNIKLASNISLKVIAKRTPGFSGADLANVINEAALLAARYNKTDVGMEELESSIDRVLAGPERKSRIMSSGEKRTVAIHESGHTLIAALLPNTDPVHKVSIIPRGTAALGYTMQLPMEDKYLTSESEILDTLCVLLGGRAAEELILQEISTGAQNDLEKVSQLSRSYVCRFGMSKVLGPQTFGRQSGNIFLGHDLVQEKEYSDKTAVIIDDEVTNIIMRSYEKVKKLINDNRDKLELLSKKLEEEEVLEGDQVLELLNIERKHPKTHKETEIAPVEQPQKSLQYITKDIGLGL